MKKELQFKISLQQTEPAVWRRILVPSYYTFWNLHVAIQDSMGWLDYHMHEFHLQRKKKKFEIGIPDDDIGYKSHLQAGWDVKLSDYFNKPNDDAMYIYDFTDFWQHDVVLEKVEPLCKSSKYPICIDGANACPPESCGGISDYKEIIEILNDSEHEQYESIVHWLKVQSDDYWPFHPEKFDANVVQFHGFHEDSDFMTA